MYMYACVCDRARAPVSISSEHLPSFQHYATLLLSLPLSVAAAAFTLIVVDVVGHWFALNCAALPAAASSAGTASPQLPCAALYFCFLFLRTGFCCCRCFCSLHVAHSSFCFSGSLLHVFLLLFLACCLPPRCFCCCCNCHFLFARYASYLFFFCLCSSFFLPVL